MNLQSGIYLLSFPKLFREYTLCNPTGTVEGERKEAIGLYKLHFDALLGDIRLHDQAAFGASIFDIPPYAFQNFSLVLFVQISESFPPVTSDFISSVTRRASSDAIAGARFALCTSFVNPR